MSKKENLPFAALRVWQKLTSHTSGGTSDVSRTRNLWLTSFLAVGGQRVCCCTMSADPLRYRGIVRVYDTVLRYKLRGEHSI